jgi:hypothetical protein
VNQATRFERDAAARGQWMGGVGIREEHDYSPASADAFPRGCSLSRRLLAGDPHFHRGGAMYELLRRLTVKQLAFEQLPLLLIAIVIAELFYKFHSFLLEAAAFLLTWMALGALYASLKSLLSPVQENANEHQSQQLPE